MTSKRILLRLLPTSSVQFLISLQSYIPGQYVTSVEEKMSLYKLMSDCKSHQALYALSRLIEEILSAMPPETSKTFTLVQMKNFARLLDTRKIMAQRQHVILDQCIEVAALKRLFTFFRAKVPRKKV